MVDKKVKEYVIDNAQLMLDWDWEKNNQLGLYPDKVTIGSNKIAWWKCSKKHEWSTKIRVRSRGSGCPICSGHQLLTGFNDLRTRFPQIAQEWNEEKNNIPSNQIVSGSHQIGWWKCAKGHEWQASPNHRTSKQRGCPYCCHNPKLLKGENDFETCYPELAKEWNYEKNIGLTPSDVTSKSNKSVWWKCSKGHEWKTKVLHRANGSGCPYCSTSYQTSFPEQVVFFYVKKYYQDAINGYSDIFPHHKMELDIFIPSLRIGIEYDGIYYHSLHYQKERELKKYEICKKNNVKLIRLREDNAIAPADIIIEIKDDLNETLLKLSDYLPLIKDIDVEKDKIIILENYKNVVLENSIGYKKPELLIEWNYEKNVSLSPYSFSYYSKEKLGGYVQMVMNGKLKYLVEIRVLDAQNVIKIRKNNIA